MNSKWIKELNIRPETLQLVHKRTGNSLDSIGIGKDILSRTPTNGQMGLQEVKSSVQQKKWSPN
jgi:hypothetical protein